MNRAGEYVSNLNGEMEYKSFLPSNLPPNPKININSDMVEKLVKANSKLSCLNMEAKHLRNIDLFISMYVRKEALLSSIIEGTQCTLEDIFNPNIQANMNLDVEDVINYVKATSFALERMEKLPLCNRLIKEIHKELLAGVRGAEKNPGEFRKSQSWIGPSNCSLREARYIPPNVSDMENALSELEKYMNEGNDYDPLIQIALIHYQFETIHPFLDGNGRIGRLIILLYLLEKKVIDAPIIYVSYFLKQNQIEYYDRMSEVRKSGNYEQWINFFLDAVYFAAVDSLETIEKLNNLRNENVELISKIKGRNTNLINLFSYIERYPIIDIGKTAKELNLSYNTTSSAVNKLVELGILVEKTNQARNRVFSYEKYLEILRKDI